MIFASELLSAVSRILHEYGVGVQYGPCDGENRGVVIRVGGLVPPCAGIELSESHQIYAPTALSEELTPPLRQHLFLVKPHVSFRRIKHIVKVGAGIIALAHRVEELGGTIAVAAAHLALGKRIDYQKSSFQSLRLIIWLQDKLS